MNYDIMLLSKMLIPMFYGTVFKLFKSNMLSTNARIEASSQKNGSVKLQSLHSIIALASTY